MTTTDAPTTDPATLDTLEASWNLPTVEPRPSGIERDPNAANVPDAPAPSIDRADYLPIALFAILLVGGVVLLAITTFG